MTEDCGIGEAIIEAVRVKALGPDWRQTATAYPLRAIGALNESGDWWGDRGPGVASARRREAAPTINVYDEGGWLAAIMVSPTGRNPTVYVRTGVKIMEVTPHG